MPRRPAPRAAQLRLRAVPERPPGARPRPAKKRRRRRGRRSLQLGLPEVPLALRAEPPALPGLSLPPAPLPVVACVREGGRLRVRVVSGGELGAAVLFDQAERSEGRRWTVEKLIWTPPRNGRGYYRTAGEVRRLEDPDEAP